MRNNLDYLPSLKRNELNSIVQVIRESCDDVEMVILFGSYARGDYKEKEDLEPDGKSGHVSDYDILVVTKRKETVDNFSLWDDVAKKCKRLGIGAHARIIAHDIQELNIKLAEGQYFFTDIKKEGCLVYNSKNFELVEERELTPEEKQRIARDHFDHWFERAQGFFDGYNFYLREKQYALASFNLHQTAESCFKAILLVFTNYNPNEHWLASLHELVVDETDSFKEIFPRATKEENDRFVLLDYAYIGGRYDPKYRISGDDLKTLEVSVGELLELAEKTCCRKIKDLAGQSN